MEKAIGYTEPEYGFIGKAKKIADIKNALAKQNILLLRGLGGVGKTTLLLRLQKQWADSKTKVFYFGYDSKAWALKDLLSTISKQIYTKEDLLQLQALSSAADRIKICAKCGLTPMY